MIQEYSRNTIDGSAIQALRNYTHNKSKLYVMENGLNLNMELPKENYENLKAEVKFVEICIEQLTARQREIIDIIFVQKVTYRQYQAINHLSKSGSESRIKRAVDAFESLYLLKNIKMQ